MDKVAKFAKPYLSCSELLSAQPQWLRKKPGACLGAKASRLRNENFLRSFTDSRGPRENVDLPNNLLDMTTNHMELESEYFVIGDTAHTPLETEVAPMTINGDITNLILLARCPQPPFCLIKGQILPQAIPIPAEVPVDRKSPEICWAEVVDEDKPSLACNLTCGSDHLHVEGVLDIGADVTIITKRMSPSL
ncbi:endogenous retrovirus group K member 25 Pro protein-like protein [Turdus rufiventris]|nr:endogenous retrovirus group K member 25 Pro protein-like protein [Turdus rufiventris]